MFLLIFDIQYCSEEIIDWQYRKTQSDTDEFTPLSMNQIIKADDDVSQRR